MKKYIIPIVSLLAMLLREMWFNVDNFNVVLSDLVDMVEDQAEPAHVIQQTHRVLLKMWTTSWPKMPNTTRITDPTEAALALMTLNQDGSFKEPKDVTVIIAKLEYCMRLTFLKEIRARADSQDGTTEALACDALQPWFTEKAYSTFARLRSLQHRASAIAYDTMGLPHIWWTDTENWTSLKYKGNPISFSDVRTMFKDMEEDLVFTWEKKILRGLALRADYADLVDDPTNKDVGYSFLFDSRNPCFQDRTRLVHAIVTGQGEFSKFLTRQEGEPIWNRAALRGWLQDYAELQKLLLLRAEMLSGAPSRGTELTAMIYRNTQTRPTRNLMVFGHHTTLLTQYSKTTALTGHEKLVPHGLDAVTSDILIQDLALARPFAQIAARACFENEEVVQLYKDMLFVNFNRKFTTEDLSSVMAKYSLPRVQFAIKVNSWRHIQTAWKRKFRCSPEAEVEEAEDVDVDALQAGHTRATENRIYGLSTQGLAGAAEDVLPLFLQASTAWQERCEATPGGRCLSYQQARASIHFKPAPPAASTARPSTHGLAQDGAATAALVNKVADQVVERIKPMLIEIMQAITSANPRPHRAPHTPAGNPEENSANTKGKNRRAETDTEGSDEPDDHEESDLQEAILASMAAQTPQGTGKQPPTLLACKKPLTHTTPQPTAGPEEKAAARAITNLRRQRRTSHSDAPSRETKRWARCKDC